MQFYSTLLLALGLALAARPAPAAFVNGRSYAPLADWAAANGLRFARTGRSDEFVVTNRNLRLEFEKDSHTAVVNGVNVALCFPVAVDKGAVLLAQLDLADTIEPLVFLPRLSPKKITTICLDPGHGGKDSGNRVGVFFSRRDEKTYTLALAQELQGQLQKAGFNVLLTRTGDSFVDLPARPALANRRGADLFVSLHFNATEVAKNEVAGPETYCITPVGASSSNAQGEGADHGACVANLVQKKSLLLAYQVQKALVKNLGVPDRSVRRARFAVLRDAAMPAILIESGYMTNPIEGRKIFSANYRRQIAAAIVKAILAYQKMTVGVAAQKTPRPFSNEHRY
jgi:N-acetylmuramoyl-L-alanine amidase